MSKIVLTGAKELRWMVFFVQNIITMVNLDLHLDLKTITLHACNTKYNTRYWPFSNMQHIELFAFSVFCSCYHAYLWTQDNCSYFCIHQDGCNWSQAGRQFTPCFPYICMYTYSTVQSHWFTIHAVLWTPSNLMCIAKDCCTLEEVMIE